MTQPNENSAFIKQPTPDTNETIFPIRDYIDILWRRRWGFILSFVCVCALGTLYTIRQPKIFEAATTVIINPEPPTVSPVEASSSDQWYLRSTYYDTQLKVMQSRLVAQRVVDDLNLATDVEFLGLSQIKDPELLQNAIANADPVARVLSGLHIESVAGTRLVKIRVKNRDPERAASIANAVAAAYAAQNALHHSAALSSTFDFINKQYNDNVKKLEQSRVALNDFKDNHKILYSNPIEQQKITNQQLEYLNTKRVDIETERQRAGHLLDALKNLPLKTDNVRAFALLSGDPNIDAEMAECRKLDQKRKELLVTYLEKSPQVVALQKQIQTCEEGVLNGMKNILTGLDAKYRAFLETNNEINGEIKSLQKEALELDQLKLLYEQFESQKQNAENQYELSQNKLNEVSLNKLLEINNIRILDTAIASSSPISPNLFINAAITLLAAFIFGCLCVLLLELLDISVRFQSDIEEKARLPFLGAVPKFPKSRQFSGKNAYRFVIENPRTPIAECLRTIHTSLDFLLSHEHSNTLLITSAQPIDGKTMMSLNLSVTAAMTGKRVVLIEADMRKPALHHALKIDSPEGLSAAISNAVSLDKVIVKTEVSNLSFIPCGAIPKNPDDLLKSQTFADILDALSKRFDLVVIDSPPVTAVTDALLIAQHANGVIIITRAGKTSLPSLIRTRELLESVRAPITGTILNDFSATKHGYYGGYYYYRKEYR